MRASRILFPMAAGLFMALVLVSGAPVGHAETMELEIVITGLDFEYNSSTISDATSEAGRNLDPSESDAVSSVMFSTESGDQSDTTAVYADLFIDGISGISEFGGSDKSSNVDSFGLDVFSTDGTPWSLQLNISQVNVVYAADPITGTGIAVAALGKASSVEGQELPFGLQMIDTSKDIQISVVSGTLSDIETTGGVLTGFSATSGVGAISAVVPEPSSLLALLTGALGLAAFACRWRKR